MTLNFQHFQNKQLIHKVQHQKRRRKSQETLHSLEQENKMDSIGAFLDEELESWIKMFSSSEDSCSFSRHFALGNLLSNENVLKVDQSTVLPSDVLETNFYSFSSQESGESSDINTALFANQPNGVHFPPHEAINTVDSMDFNTMGCNNVPVFTDEVMEEILQLKAQLCNDQLNYATTHLSESCTEKQLKRKCEAPHTQSEEMSSKSPKKKSRVPRNAQQSKRNVQSRKKKVNNEEDNSSEDTSNTTQEPNEGSTSESKDCLNSNGKERSGKGCATDPQSLYARRRRERINERFRILQNLVPNGTKVDLSTMLEEAVHYVKFLQIQIKLLSSDDLWMYAPIAYNGMDIGLCQQMMLPNLWLQD